MFNLICVTNRRLCRDDFLTRLSRLAKGGVDAIILREKDLSPEAYEALAAKVLAVCRREQVQLIIHSHPETASKLGLQALQLPLPLLSGLRPEAALRFPELGSSVHSPAEAVLAAEAGCRFIVAGHVFETACKAGVPGRGLGFLEAVRLAADEAGRKLGQDPIALYAIGGIHAGNIRRVKEAGADGACLMSRLMAAEEPEAYLDELRRRLAYEY